jgi:predicted secreted protein
LEVPGANTTGYLWQIKTDSSAVEIVGHEIVPDDQSFGGAGVERFFLKPPRTGDASLHLELKAPWESEAAQVHSVLKK